MKKENTKTILFGGISNTPEERAEILFNHPDNNRKDKIIERHIIEYIPAEETEPMPNMFQSNLGIMPIEYMEEPQTRFSRNLKQERRERVNEIRVKQRTNVPQIQKNPKEKMDYINKPQRGTMFNPNTTGSKEELSSVRSLKKDKDYEKIAEMFYPEMEEKSQIQGNSKKNNFDLLKQEPFYIEEDEYPTIADTSYILPIDKGIFTGAAANINNCYTYEDLKNMAVSEDDKNFFILLDYLLELEGGYSNRKNDKGGPTNLGIIQDTYNYYNKKHNLPIKNVKNITLDEALKIYHDEFWKRSGASSINDKAMSFVYFDAAVNHGPGYAWRHYNNAEGNVNKFLESRYKHYLDLKNKSEEEKKNQQKNISQNVKQKNIVDNTENYEGWINRLQKLRNLLLKHTDYNDNYQYTIDKEFIRKKREKRENRRK